MTGDKGWVGDKAGEVERKLELRYRARANVDRVGVVKHWLHFKFSSVVSMWHTGYCIHLPMISLFIAQ